MTRLRDLSLSRKLTLIVVSTTVLAMVAASMAIIYFEGVAIRRSMISELQTTADLLGANAAVAIRFDVPHDGDNILNSLRAKPQIRGACILRPDGSLFARYARGGIWEPGPSARPTTGHAFSRSDLTLTQEIRHDEDMIGYIHLQSDLDPLWEKRRQAIVTTVLSIFTFSAIALVCCFYLLGIVARPIDNLVRTTNEVSATQNYSLRAQRFGNDDLGVLTERFNNMLEQIQKRESELEKIQLELQARVTELDAEKHEVELAHGRERELQDRLSRSQRLESLGILAGGVAHDLNNILGPVVIYPELIAEQLPADEQNIRALVNRLGDSAKKAAGVIRNLLTLGRRGNIVLNPTELNELIEAYFESSDYLALKGRFPAVEVRRDLARHMCAISASPHHLNQAIMNLVINAHEAMSAGGVLTVETRNIELTEPLNGYQTIAPGAYARVRISDTGPGVNAEKLGRIFEPFFTDKEMGKSGSGLGLAVVYGVIQDLNGRIDVQSATGSGACFDLYFPCLRVRAAPATPSLPTARGEQRILVVDDAPEQREVSKVVLSTLGYSVETAENGHRALERLAKESFDLILLDMIMEVDFDGLDTYREIIRLHPGQKCIIASGFAESDRIKEARRLGVGGFLAKPYSMSAIGTAVRAELDRAT